MISRRTFLRAAGIPFAGLLGLKLSKPRRSDIVGFRKGFDVAFDAAAPGQDVTRRQILCVSTPFHDEPFFGTIWVDPDNGRDWYSGFRPDCAKRTLDAALWVCQTGGRVQVV